MDIGLEIADTFAFDILYAKILPASLSNYLEPQIGSFKNATASTSALWDTVSQHPYGQYVLKYLSPNDVKIYGVDAPLHLFEETPWTHASLLGRANMLRQSLTLFTIMTIFGWLLYLSVASLSYVFVYDKANFNHPRYLKNQISLEIKHAMSSIPVMVIFTVPWFLLELRGYSKLYWEVNESNGGYWALVYQLPCFIMFTDCWIYFIHRALHWPSIYKTYHKPHHKWIVCTPFASHAFHPFDGYAQSLPYHWYPFLFPLHKVSYLVLFTFVNFWTVMIHDGEYMSNDPIINGAACHTIHHLYFNYNYGQFTTLWDRMCGSYKEPDRELFDSKAKKDKKTWEKQAAKMDQIRTQVEGKDDFRVYEAEESLKKQT
ncbi:unnamed protein product [Kuraishia capsulata CBS 1993]|uniref:Fatty acid hydroxylase domain-containing protein n=1 Tax=Kuraishia capsulata CBS 1993 TaxID=1382522 RepID=W6MXK9_9ASCO|nr:uncharacterized protein KUCA_T00005057001 [Kuraishia capsulata CBS 1993]CDK29070.1 unnamed protein product [Kuraishia capsulata CBS 1993]